MSRLTRLFRFGAVTLAFLASLACGHQSRAQVAAERATLERRISGLEAMLVVVRQDGHLLPRDHLLIVVREQLVEESLSSVLPYETVLKGTYRIRLEAASVQFEDGLAILRLDGEAQLVTNLEAKARVSLHGGMDVVDIDASGMLRLRAKIYAVETRTTRLLGLPAPVEELVERIGKEQVDVFAPLLSAIDIPVRLDKAITLPKMGPEGGISIDGYSVPLEARVKDVKSFYRRLWITVGITEASPPIEVPS